MAPSGAGADRLEQVEQPRQGATADSGSWQRLHHHRLRTEVPEFSPAMLLRHSFMAALAGLRRNPQVGALGSGALLLCSECC